jgi:ribonuclease-3
MSKTKYNIEENFNDKELLNLALTHRSWVNEHSGTRGSNERLEFLGDAILEFVVSRELYVMFPDKEEGFLTSLRSKLVNTQNLSNIAKKLDLGSKIFLSKGEEETGGRTNNSILADTVEAVIGALFLDGGIVKSEEFIKKELLSDIKSVLSEPLKDPKSMLQEIVQSKGFSAPKYKVIKEEGPDHDKRFTIQAIVNDESWGEGTGKNKSEAAQAAAHDALIKKDLIKSAS